MSKVIGGEGTSYFRGDASRKPPWFDRNRYDSLMSKGILGWARIAYHIRTIEEEYRHSPDAAYERWRKVAYGEVDLATFYDDKHVNPDYKDFSVWNFEDSDEVERDEWTIFFAVHMADNNARIKEQFARLLDENRKNFPLTSNPKGGPGSKIGDTLLDRWKTHRLPVLFDIEFYWKVNNYKKLTREILADWLYENPEGYRNPDTGALEDRPFADALNAVTEANKMLGDVKRFTEEILSEAQFDPDNPFFADRHWKTYMYPDGRIP